MPLSKWRDHLGPPDQAIIDDALNGKYEAKYKSEGPMCTHVHYVCALSAMWSPPVMNPMTHVP